MITQTIDEWRAEATARFGHPVGWAFQCPHCGYVTCVAEWKLIGADPSDAPVKCIGRKLPESRGDWTNHHQPCNWAAFGLLGTLSGGRRIEFPYDGKVMDVFDFPDRGRPRDVLDFIDRAERAGEEHQRTTQLVAAQAMHRQTPPIHH